MITEKNIYHYIFSLNELMRSFEIEVRDVGPVAMGMLMAHEEVIVDRIVNIIEVNAECEFRQILGEYLPTEKADLINSLVAKQVYANILSQLPTDEEFKVLSTSVKENSDLFIVIEGDTNEPIVIDNEHELEYA